MLGTNNKLLSITHPHLLEEWNYKKNNALNLMLDVLTYGSSKKAWWICKSCGYEWESTISNRTAKKPRGCKRCAGMTVTDRNRLTIKRPDLATQWDYKKNFPDKPEDFSYASNAMKFWICSNCKNEWEDTIEYRSRSKNDHCRKCNMKQITDDNCLENRSPELSKSWNYEKNNGLTPRDVTSNTTKVYWWICPQGHEYKKSCNARQNGRGCPQCAKHIATSFGEQSVLYYVKKVFPETKNREKIANDYGKDVEFDIFIPSLKIAIEYDGVYYHKDRQEEDEKKNNFAKSKGIFLIRLREVGLAELNGSFNILDVSLRTNKVDKSIDVLMKYLFIFSHNKLNQETVNRFKRVKVNIKKDRIAIEEELIGYVKKNSIAITHTDIAKEWDYNLNGKLKPDHFSHGSNKPINWICSKGHKWNAKISDRAYQKQGCPYCKGRRVVYENSLEVVCPDLASEWHPTKNGSLTPVLVSKSSSEKVYWIVKGKERYATVNKRYEQWKEKQRKLKKRMENDL